MTNGERSAVVLGARNLGAAIAARLIQDGWRVAAVARSDDSLEALAKRGVLALKADAAKPRTLTAALEIAAEEHGGLDLVVNAVQPQRPPAGSAQWGGPLDRLDLDGFQGWGSAVAEQAYVFLHTGINALRPRGGGVLIQVTGGAAVTHAAGRAAWSAGCAAVRSLVLSACEELRGEPIYPCLLAVHGQIGSAAERVEIAGTVAYLAGPKGRRAVPEVHLHPLL